MRIERIISLLLSSVITISCSFSLTSKAESETQLDTKMIALTFDDGPNTHTTPQVLDLLEEYDAKASFFLIGDKITEESSVVAKRAFDMGCELDSHSKTHSDMSIMSSDDIIAEMKYVDEKVFAITGEYPKFFRPPYLNVSQTMYDSIDLPFITGYSSGDSNAEKTAQERAETVLSTAKDGAIILMHDFYGNDQSVEALKIIIPELKTQGYEFVTLSELFEAKGEAPVYNFCYSEVTKHPCGEFLFSEKLFSGRVTGTKDWSGWKESILLNGEMLENLDKEFTIEVTYESTAPPIIVLHRWKSSEDNLWKAIKPVYYNGTKACFKGDDMQAVLDTYGFAYTDMDYIIVRTNWTEMTITNVDLFIEPDSELIGDVNSDGYFNSADLVTMSKWLKNNIVSDVFEWRKGDLIKDNILNIFDFCEMRKALIKLEV